MAQRDAFADLARTAGEAILAIRRAGFDVHAKGDGSPVTEADVRSQAILVEGLSALTPGIAWVGEEHAAAPYAERAAWGASWCIDPLDGTRDFVAGTDDFSINLGLIVAGRPAFGLIHAPARDVTYVGAPGVGAFRRRGGEALKQIAVAYGGKRVRVIVSRFHAGGRAAAFIADLEQRGHEVTLVRQGSALKMCRIAEGSADVYPRFGATYEWDTAAGEAILIAAGGIVAAIDGGGPLAYNKADLRNPAFFAAGPSAPRPSGT
jgi:3'(2'), 5'-bisphosphate nucleotidase